MMMIIDKKNYKNLPLTTSSVHIQNALNRPINTAFINKIENNTFNEFKISKTNDVSNETNNENELNETFQNDADGDTQKFQNNLLKMPLTKLNTKFIASKIHIFLKKHSIDKKHFCNKILGTSTLLYENLVEKPKDWSKLNSMFKLYYKKMNSFINNVNEQRNFIEHVRFVENRDAEIVDKIDLIRYDISQIIIDGSFVNILI